MRGHFRAWANSRFRRTHPTIHQSGIPGLTETIPYSPPRRNGDAFRGPEFNTWLDWECDMTTQHTDRKKPDDLQQ
jgi:hypothetical protein